MARVQWTDLRATDERDCYGVIMIQTGKTKEGLVVFRRRRRRNRKRYMFWSEVGRVRSASLDDVLCEIVPNYSIS